MRIVPDTGARLHRREAKHIDQIRVFLASVLGGKVKDSGLPQWFQGLIPMAEDKSISEGRCLALVFGHLFTTDGVTSEHRAVRVLEDDDRGADYVEMIRHFRVSVLVVRAAAREDEGARAVHSFDPIVRSLEIIVQSEHTHLDVVQAGTTLEHASVTLWGQFPSWQFRSLDNAHTPTEHAVIATRFRLFGGQRGNLRQAHATIEHVMVAQVAQLVGWQGEDLAQGFTGTEHIGITALRQATGQQ